MKVMHLNLIAYVTLNLRDDGCELGCWLGCCVGYLDGSDIQYSVNKEYILDKH